MSVTENVADAFYTATATDPQNDPVTISVYSGVDAQHFVIDGTGGLKFDVPANYDLPADQNQDNVYEVTLRASAGGESVDFSLRVTVLNDKEGIKVTRIAEGIPEPTSFTNIINQPTLLIASKDGRVFTLDTQSNTLAEDIFIRDNRLPGEALAIAFGFPDSIYQEGTYLITHDSSIGLQLQAFNAARSKKGSYRLGDASAQVPTASMLNSGTIFIAIGDPEGSQAQSVSSPYGKLMLPLGA